MLINQKDVKCTGYYLSLAPAPFGEIAIETVHFPNEMHEHEFYPFVPAQIKHAKNVLFTIVSIRWKESHEHILFNLTPPKKKTTTIKENSN